MNLGDVVQWTSSASGVSRHKEGEIVAVVPAGAYPHEVAIGLGNGYATGPLRGFGLPRKDDSYLVAVRGEGNSKPRLYWPRVSKLSVVEQKEAA